MARLARPSILTCLATVVGCHLIGGVHDLDYSGTGGGAGTGGVGVGGDAGGGAGAGGMVECPSTCVPPCCDDQSDTCDLAEPGTTCDGGACDGMGICATGMPVWGRYYGGDGADDLRAVATLPGPNGPVLVVGGTIAESTQPTNVFRGGHAPSGTDGMVATVDVATGDLGWRLPITYQSDSMDDASVTALATVGTTLYVAGRFYEDIQLASGMATVVASAIGVGEDGFVAKLDQDGDAKWIWWSFGPGGEDESAWAVDANESVVAVTGFGKGNIRKEGDSPIIPLDLPGSLDQMWLATVSPTDGQPVQSVTVDAGCNESRGNAVLLQQAKLWLLMDYRAQSGPCMVDTYSAGSTGDIGSRASLLIEFVADGSSTDLKRPADGAALRLAATNDRVIATALAERPNGNIIIAGTYTGSLTPTGLDPLPASTGAGPFLVEVDGDAVPLWAVGFPTAVPTDQTFIKSVSVDDAGNLVVTGHHVGELVVGTTTIDHADQTGFAFKTSPQGTALWLLDLESTGSFEDAIYGATTVDGDLFLVGSVGGDVLGQTGGAPTAPLGAGDMFIGRLTP